MSLWRETPADGAHEGAFLWFDCHTDGGVVDRSDKKMSSCPFASLTFRESIQGEIGPRAADLTISSRIGAEIELGKPEMGRCWMPEETLGGLHPYQRLEG